jgi:sirohydrochlorin ferrochelatase
MIVALIDNGSLEPAVQRNLRHVAATLSARTGTKVHAVSWKHSDRIDPTLLDDTPAWSLNLFLRSFVALGQREFVFVPFFLSPQGAIGSALHDEIKSVQRELGCFEFRFSDGLAERGVVSKIVAERVRVCRMRRGLNTPPVIVVDHGGPSAASAALREELTAEIRQELRADASLVASASLEGVHPPLLTDLLRADPFASEDVIVAPLFLAPGRHAGPDGDLARICQATHPRSHLTDLVGTHPLAVDALAEALRRTLPALHAYTFA